jgi:hypothetical protein
MKGKEHGVIGLTTWRLFAVAGVGALIESEDLVARTRHARVRAGGELKANAEHA